MENKIRIVSIVIALCLIVSLLSSTMPISADETNCTVCTYENATVFVAPDIIEDDELNRNHYIGRTLEDEKDIYTFVFENDDGSNTMRVFSHPVKYVNECGETKDISLEIAPNGDGTYKAANHFVDATFSSDMADGISIEYEDIKVRMSVNNSVTAKGNTFMSDDSKSLKYVIDDKTSYIYSLTYAGIKENILVNEYTGQTEYEFILSTNGLHPIRIDDMVFLANEDGEIKATIGDIIVFTADERNNTFGELAYEPIIENSVYRFTIILDKDFLKDKKTVYPITIDPTIEVKYNNNGAGAIEDITVKEDGTFSGTLWSLYVGRHPAGALSRSLMRFPNLKLDILPTNIIAASIEIRDLMCQSDEDIKVECYVYKEFAPVWSESGTTTWDDVYGNYLGTKLDSHIISYGNGNVPNNNNRYSYNILGLARKWAAGIQDPAHGVVFKASDAFEEQTGANIQTWYKTFSSYNRSSYRPSLSITYNTIRLMVGKTKDISSAAAGLTGVTWSSSNTNIATVNNGIVTGVSSGTATISFTAGSSTTNCNVQVRSNGGTTYVSGGSLPKKASLSVSSGTSYIIRLYPTSSGHYSFFTSPESTTTLTNTTIAVYSDSALTNVMAFDDNGGYSLNACVSVYLNAYTYYYFVLSAFSTTSSGVVTYNIMKGLPVSGSEIDYDPNMWNLTNLLGNTNCYAYALNCQTNPPGATHTFLQIGQSVLGMFGLDITHYTPDGSEVLYYVQQDSSNWGFYFSEISRTAMCSSGKYKVALVIDPYYDFHWYRQNPDGTWSHKPGPNTVRDYDYSTQTIYDPATANRDNGIDLNYEYVIGFYEVTPLNSNAFSIGLGEGFLTEEVEAIITQSSIKASSLSTLARFQDSSD